MSSEPKTCPECGRTFESLKSRNQHRSVSHDTPIDDPEELRQLITEEKLSTTEIGERYGFGRDAIVRRLNKFDIPPLQEIQVTLREDERGYQQWITTHENESYVCYVHRLLAVSEYGFEAVSENIVHHKNGLKWDNRPENIEIMTQSEHIGLHRSDGDL